MQHIMQTHIRQHIAGYLKWFLGHGAWLPSSDVKRFLWGSEGVCPSVKWLCSFAGADAMGTAAVVTTVLTEEHDTCYTRERTARVVIEAGKQLDRSHSCASWTHAQCIDGPSIWQSNQHLPLCSKLQTYGDDCSLVNSGTVCLQAIQLHSSIKCTLITQHVC
jgi:hypothetical protein